MAHQRRVVKGPKHDIINVTEIDDDLDELSLSGGSSSYKTKVTTTPINGHVKPKYKDPLSSNNYKDPLKSMNVKDPFAEKKELNSSSNNKMPESVFSSTNNKMQESVLLNYESVFKTKPTQSSLNVQSGQNKNGISTQSSSHATPSTTTTTPSTTSSRGSTQINRNQHFTSTQSSKRNNAPTRINKNQKGFSHEEKDLYIDDIEDF